jgi:hypothetical protein
MFPANDRKLEAVTLQSGGPNSAITLVMSTNGTEQQIACGYGAWTKGRATWGSSPERPAAACGAWTADDTFTAKICFFETPFVSTVRLKFSGDELRLSSESNVGFGSTRDSELVGKIEP